MNVRKIIHIDMDAFFAAVEERDDPELKGKAVAVGYGGNRGVVATANYEARKFGVHSAMASVTAMRKCPQLIFVKPRFEVYKQVSKQIHSIFQEYTPLVEPLSLDEAYLDVTENKLYEKSATQMAEEIKLKIFSQTGLTASAGVSFNKFLAKIASGFQKPNGLTVIPPSKAVAFIEKLDIGKFHGIGRVTAEKMRALGIYSGKELRTWSREKLVKAFGKSGAFYYEIAQLEDYRSVNPDRIRKSIGAENTFMTDLLTVEEMMAELEKIADMVIKRADRASSYGKTMTLKIKFDDFEQITRSKTMMYPITDQKTLLLLAENQLQTMQPFSKGVRLLGLSLSNLTKPDEKGIQLRLPF